MSWRTVKKRELLIILTGLIPNFGVFLVLPPDLYLYGLIGLIAVNIGLLAVLVPSAIALQDQTEQDKQPTVFMVLNQPN